MCQPLFTKITDYEEGTRLASTLKRRTQPLIAFVCYYDQEPADINAIAKRFNKVAQIVELKWDGQVAFNANANGEYIAPGCIRVWKADGSSRYWRPLENDDMPQLIYEFLHIDNDMAKAAKEVKLKSKPAEVIKQLKTQVKDYKKDINRLESLVPNPDNWALDWRKKLDEMLRYRWLQRIPAANKADMPLPSSWSYEDSFEPNNWANSADIWKTIDVMLEVLLALDTRLNGRKTHTLRVNAGADSGARYYNDLPIKRVNVTASPSAPRLGYVKDNDGHITFLDVTVHDDLLA